MSSDVHYRTGSIELNTIRTGIQTACAAIRDELASGSSPALASLLALDAEVAQGIQALLALGMQLPPSASDWSRAAVAVLEVLETLFEKLSTDHPDFDLALGLDEQVEDLVLAVARREVATAVRAARGTRSIRNTATKAGISVGYLSELESGKPRKVGLPSLDVCAKLDGSLGTDLQGLVAGSKEKIRSLKLHAQKRRSTPIRATGEPSTSLEFRLQMAADKLAKDERLLAFVEIFTRLPSSARRGIEMLVGQLQSIE